MDRIFEKNSIEQICDDIIRVLRKSKEHMEDILSMANEAENVFSDVPDYAKEIGVSTAISTLKAHINGMNLDTVISSLEKCKNSVDENIIAADRQYAKETDALVENINRIREAFSQIHDFLVDTHLSCDYKDFMANLEVAKAKCNEIIEDAKTALSRLLMHVKGEEIKSVFFSKDPVNLSTGNFIYSHVDLVVKGGEPFVFRRFYNSVNHRNGILGRDWNHNHEIILESDHENKVLLLEDGREERFVLASTGEYVALYQSTGGLKRSEEGFTYSTREQRKYHFDAEGYCLSQETLNGGCIQYIYENFQDLKRLKKIERTTGEFFELSYDGNGFLSCICDHVGRKIYYKIEGNLLTAVSTPDGAWHCYAYTAEGKLEYTQNPEEIVTVKNTYDENMRTTMQEFPDGSTMTYIYDDKNRTVELTERNGSKTVFVHDDKYRDVKHIFSDGEERFEYNKLNQKTLFVDKLGNKTQYGYDSYGNRTRVINPLGNQMILRYGDFNQLVSVAIDGVQKVVNRYDGKGNLLESEDAEGNIFKFHYQKQGQVDQIQQPDGGIVCLERDSRGNITSLIDPNGVRHLFFYDSLNQVVATVDGNGNRTSYEYDNNGNLVKVTDPYGNARIYTYNRNNKVTRIEDFDGSIIMREYNALNLPSKVVDQMGRTTVLSYDSMWNLARVTQPNGARTTFIYNEHNNMTRIRNANGDVVRFTYDAAGHRISKSDELGNISRFFYDAAGRLIKAEAPEGGCTEYQYDAEGHVTRVQDAMENKVYLQYDKNGRLIWETNPLGECRIYTYDCMGQLSSITDETGQVTRYEYEKCGHLVRIVYPEGKSASYTYDGNGNVITYTNPKGYVLTYTYDALDRVIKIEGSGGEKKYYEYDCMGNVLSMEDGQGAVTRYEYSLTGKLIKVIDPFGNETIYEYDDRDRLITACEFDGNIDNDLREVQERNKRNCRVTHYEHDLMGNITKVADSFGHAETYEYDKAGRLTAKIDKEGYLTKYGYTSSGSIEHIQYADGREVKMSYNPIRQLTQIEDWLGITRITNDAMGHVTNVRYPDGKDVSYTYGPRGERTGIRYPDGSNVTYEYNGFTRLQKMIFGKHSISYEYDDTGFLTRKALPNGVETNYQYNEKGLLERLEHSDTTGVMDVYQYQYDSLGNRSSVTKLRRGIEKESGKFEYGYDLLGRLATVSKGGELQRAYTYDAFGNRSSMTEKGAETRYVYNVMGQLISKAEDGIETKYEYDKRGNLAQIEEGGTVVGKYFFDAMNRLQEAENASGQIARYTYNGVGQRVRKSVWDKTDVNDPSHMAEPALHTAKDIEYRIDMTRQYHNLLQEKENGREQLYLWDGGLTALLSGKEPEYYLKDELGSPIRLLDQDGELHESYAYDEFGREQMSGNITQKQTQPFGFTGYQYDATAGMYFAQAREYQPSTGRFMEPDLSPGFKSAPFTMNRYTYCYNNPIRLVDRNGMWPSLDDIEDTLTGWGNAIDNTLDDWGDAVNKFIADPHKAISEAVDNVAAAVSGLVEDVSTAVTDLGHKNADARKAFFEKLQVIGRPLCNSYPVQIMTFATQQGWVDDILEDFDFKRDNAGVFHTTPDCWQQYMGYCDMYDWFFDAGTSMKTNKYTIDMENGDDYCIWMWKGDYLNLGAGTETGIYKGGEPFWDISVQDALPMKITLYDKDGNTIMYYAPENPQWWITGFDPMVQNVSEDDLKVIGSIDMKSNPDLWETFCEQYNNAYYKEFCFDEKNMTVYYNW